MRRTLVIVVLMFGCASKQPQVKKEVPLASAGQPKPKGTMRCHMERDTGSNYMERVCTYQDVKAEQGDTSLDDGMLNAERRALQHSGPGSGQPGSSGGGGH
jgi:hypothetical protein